MAGHGAVQFDPCKDAELKIEPTLGYVDMRKVVKTCLCLDNFVPFSRTLLASPKEASLFSRPLEVPPGEGLLAFDLQFDIRIVYPKDQIKSPLGSGLNQKNTIINIP